mmetsp:Transcript_15543/g.37640  ORF Transcript_15543/g.37640 Transcript_15543/m.37640 type:complete len:420 (-) Transcript_15543:231-1490(-)
MPKCLLYTAVNWYSAAIMRLANQRACSACCARAAPSSPANLTYTKPWLSLSTCTWLTAPWRPHSSLTSSAMSSHHSGSVSAAASNMFLRSRHCVGMGDPGPSTPCMMGWHASGSCGALAAANASALMSRPVMGSMPPCSATLTSCPARRAMSAARPRESMRSPSLSSSMRSSCCAAAAAYTAAMPGGAVPYPSAAAVVAPAPHSTPPAVNPGCMPVPAMGIVMLGPPAPGGSGATNTLSAWPTSSSPLSCEMASMACAASLYCTKPAPTPRPVAASRWMVMKSVSPNGSNTAFRSSSRMLMCRPVTCSLQGPTPRPGGPIIPCMPCTPPCPPIRCALAMVPEAATPAPGAPGAQARGAVPSFFCACAASHAIFFSASEDLTITTWLRSIWPVMASAAAMNCLSAYSMYAMPLLRGVLRS